MFDYKFLQDLKNNKHLWDIPKNVIEYVNKTKHQFKIIPNFKINHNQTNSLYVVEQLRNLGFSCIEEQYSNIPIIKHPKIVYKNAIYTVLKLPYGHFKLIENNDNLTIIKLN